MLASMLLEMIVQDNLYDVVLDEREPRTGGRQRQSYS